MLNREIDEDVASIRQLLERFFTNANGKLLNHDVCTYTNTPDRNFIIDFHLHHPQVLIVAGCSGHSFKFAPVAGEMVRNLPAGKHIEEGMEMFHPRHLWSDRLT